MESGSFWPNLTHCTPEHRAYKHFLKAVAVPLTGAQNAPGSVLRTFGDFTAIYPFYRLENCGYSMTGPVRGKDEFQI